MMPLGASLLEKQDWPCSYLANAEHMLINGCDYWDMSTFGSYGLARTWYLCRQLNMSAVAVHHLRGLSLDRRCPGLSRDKLCPELNLETPCGPSSQCLDPDRLRSGRPGAPSLSSCCCCAGCSCSGEDPGDCTLGLGWGDMGLLGSVVLVCNSRSSGMLS